MTELGKYLDAASTVADMHEYFDAGLVRNKAAEHGIEISEGHFFQPLIPGAYNVRIPKAIDTEALWINRDITRIARTCMEYRVSGYIGQMYARDTLVWADAGGSVQPNDVVRDADLELWDAMFALNPALVVDLYFHEHLCGGANFYTDGHFGSLPEYERGPGTREDKEMIEYAMTYFRAVRELNPSSEINLFRAEIYNPHQLAASRSQIA